MPGQRPPKRMRRSYIMEHADDVSGVSQHRRRPAAPIVIRQPGLGSQSVYDGLALPEDKGLHIRLLEITNESSTGPDEPICCKLRVVSLDLAIRNNTYTALSYMWGTEDAVQKIILNGKPVMVRRNLWDFLSQQCRVQQRRARRLKLQKHKRDARARYLWIDALCINQADATERSCQVAIMGQIYTRASRVLIWLGPDKKDLKKCLDILERLEVDPRERHESRMKTVGELMPFTYHRYWSRAWIFQECVLAKKLLIRCGSRKTLERSLRKLYAYFKTIELHVFYTPVYRILEARAKWHDEVSRTYIGLCDDPDPKPECSDARDRIYSRIAMMVPSMKITPDYNKSTVELFAELVDHHFSWDRYRAERLLIFAWNLDLLESVSWEHVERGNIVVRNKAREAKEFVESGKTKQEFLAWKQGSQRHHLASPGRKNPLVLRFS